MIGRRLILLLGASALVQAHQLRIPLDGEWRIQTASDEARFAEVEYDDRSWPAYSLPRALSPLGSAGVPGGTYWLRRTVEIPREFADEEIVLSLGTLHDSYEVFANGRRVGKTYDPDHVWSIETARPRAFRIPAIQSDRLTIAIRASDENQLHRWRIGGQVSSVNQRPDEGPYVLTGVANAPAEIARIGHERRLHTATPSLVECIADGLLAFVLFVLYWTARESAELRTLALMLISLSLLRGSQYASVFFDLPKNVLFFAPSISALVSVWLASFVFQVSGFTSRWLRYTLIFLCVATVLPRLGALAYSDFWLIPDSFLVAAIAVLSAGCALAGLIRAARERSWARPAVWLNMIGLALVMVDSQRTPTLRLVSPFWSARDMTGDIFDITVLSLSLVSTFLLLRRLGIDRLEKQRLAGEMEAARTLQGLLMPASATAGVDTVYLPASEVGGDFWHLLDDRLVVVGDVSGKGLKAAMVVSLIAGALRNRKSDSPAALLAELNAVVQGNGSGFVTCCVARLDGDRVVIANAGHPAPYLAGRELELTPGLPLGVVPDAEYTEETFAMEGPMTMVSDGVIEAANAKGELFGFERTAALSGRSAGEIAEAARAWGQNDDITVVTVRRSG